MAPPRFFDEVPQTVQEWQAKAAEAGVTNKNLQGCQQLSSGSKITQEQFLLFRTICPEIREWNDLAGTNFISPVNLQTARNTLVGSQDLHNYLAAVGTDQWRNIGKFERVLEQQCEVIRGLRHRNILLSQQDEDVVNSSFLLLLQTILSLRPSPTRRWRVSKIRLTADFGTTGPLMPRTNRVHRFIAVTDGQLQDIATDNVEAIVECKRQERREHSPQVDMQEIAQIVAWVKQYPDPVGTGQDHQSVTVSQDGGEIYMSFHRYNDRWVDYLRNYDPNADTGFMETNRFGPWKVKSAAQMRDFAEVALAVAL